MIKTIKAYVHMVLVASNRNDLEKLAERKTSTSLFCIP